MQRIPMIVRIAVSMMFLSASAAAAQEELSPAEVAKRLGKFNAYADVDRRDKDHVFLNVGFRGAAPKPADIVTIAEIVKQSAMPVALNLNQNQAIDDAA